MIMQRRFWCAVPGQGRLHARCVQTAGVQTCRKLCCFTVAVLDKAVDVPVIKQRRLRSGSVPDSVHRQTPWTFQLCNRLAYGGYGGDVFLWAWDGVFGGIDAFFRAPPGCPGVERQFLEPSTTKSSSLSRAPLANSS